MAVKQAVNTCRTILSTALFTVIKRVTFLDKKVTLLMTLHFGSIITI